MQNQVVRHVLSFLLLFFGAFAMVSADVSCGSIIIPENELYEGSEREEYPIDDCDNPFGITVDGYTVPLHIAGVAVVPDGAISIPEEGTFDYTKHSSQSLYHHVDGDFVYFETFPDGPSKPLVPGTYTAVYKTVALCLSQGESLSPRSLLAALWGHIIPTAHAMFCSGENKTQAITFTLLPQEPEPLGASSVLFLPGIQASRLYVADDGDGVTTNERVWEPGNNNDIRALAMNSNGESVQNIYTKDILDVITTDLIFNIKVYSGTIYDNFSNFLDTLVHDETIVEWRPYAYDWRYSVFDVVQNGTRVNGNGDTELLLDTVLEMSEKSYSKKVTIVAHSNGGLLAKALVRQLEMLGRDDLIDQVIFIGSPHLGTPKAVGSLLHGYDQELLYGLVGRQSVAREMMNNFPGAYGLLPSPEYLNKAGAPVVVFDDSTASADYRQKYGTAIDSLEEYNDFLASNHQDNPLDGSSKIPAPINQTMFEEAMSYHQEVLDDFSFPESIRIKNIIGTGLATPISIRYAGLHEKECSAGASVFCTQNYHPTPLAIMSLLGDGTVADISANAVEAEVEYYIDLNKTSAISPGFSYTHANMAESTFVQHLVHSFILETQPNSSDVYFQKRPVFEEKFTVQKVASPLQIVSTDSNGRQTGVTQTNGDWEEKREIPGSDYFEFAGVKYLITPSSVPIATTLSGTGEGEYSYFVSQIYNNEQSDLVAVRNATTTTGMQVELKLNGNEISDLEVDVNNDGVPDYTIASADGVVTYFSQVNEVAETQSGKRTGGTKINPAPKGLVAGATDVQLSAEEEYLKQLFLLLSELREVLVMYNEVQNNV